MNDRFIVFFDTFTHEGQIKENSDCVIFKNGIQLTELRILPFGSVVECNISDEPIIGATNPASFDIRVYSNSRLNNVVLQDIAKLHFDEKLGIASIPLNEPIQSNFLLFRGRYSTLTVAIFGIPILPLNPAIPPVTDLSVPPPQFPIPVTTGEAPCPVATFQLPPGQPFTTCTTLQPVEDKPCAIAVSQPNDTPILSESSLVRTESTSTLDTLPQKAESEVVNTASTEPIGFYEDGEVQDIDYEEISSNEELFSDIDGVDSNDDGRNILDSISEHDPRLERCLWRFNPWSMALTGETGSATERLRIPDPTATLFQLHCWLLEHGDRSDQFAKPLESSLETSNKDVKESDAISSNLLPPPPDDWTASEASADYLLSLTEKFKIALDTPVDENWVVAIESLETHLAPGLAFLYHTNKGLFQATTQTLMMWVYMGLDLSTALRQPDSTFIVRHLLAGIRLAGSVTGTLCPQVAWSLLCPEMSSLPFQAAQVLQIQHLLLNLMESPLLTSSVKLSICRSLDQTTRLSIGLDAFLGRPSVYVSEENSNQLIESASPMEHFESKSVGMAENLEPSSGDLIFSAAKCDDENKASVDEAPEEPTARTPYQRFVLLFSECKNARVTAACQRFLNKVHAYELLLEFHDFITHIQSHDSTSDKIDSTLESEHKLIYLLSQINQLLRNATTLMAHPGSAPPCVILMDQNKQSPHNPFPDLCSMIDATKLLDDLVWLLECFKPIQHCAPVAEESSEASYDCAGTPESTCEQEIGKPAFLTHQSDGVWRVLTSVLTSLMAEWNTLTFLASRPESTGKLLNLLLKSEANYELAVKENDHSGAALERLALGLELAYKMEAIRHLDVLIDWTRKKGVTGTHLAVAQLMSQTDDWEQSEPALHNALFGLSRLCVSHLNATCLGEVDEQTFEASTQILSASGPAWIAQVCTMDDNFAPFLMLVQAFAAREGSTDSTASKPEPGEKGVNPIDAVNSDGAPNSSKATLRSLLSNPLGACSLVNAVMCTVLLHGEDVTYVDRYGHQLAKLVQAFIWEDSLNESTVVTACGRLQSFSRAGAPFLSWLREFPIKSTNQNIASLCATNCLFSESFTWLVNQLKPLCAEFEEAMLELLSIETADELSNGTTCRRQGIVAGRCLPPALVILLRLLRARVCERSSAGGSLKTERQLLLNQSLALIELFSADGLHRLSTLIEKMTNFFLLNCQATISQASSDIDLIGVSAVNSNVTILLGCMDCSVHIVSQLLSTIVHVQRKEFEDLTPIRPLCQAYACAHYAICAPGPKKAIAKRIRAAVVCGLLAYMNNEDGLTLSVKDIKSSLWVSVVREVIAHTISAPMFYISGLHLLLELLPLSLPITSLRPLDDSSKRQIQSARDRWAIHLFALIADFTGLVELLAGTDPVTSNPLYNLLIRLVQRLADLGAPYAEYMASSCLDTLFSIFGELLEPKQDQDTGSPASTDADTVVKSSSISVKELPALQTPGLRLLLQPSTDVPMNSPIGSTVHLDPTKQSVFSRLEDTTELTSTLSFLYLNLQTPACRLAILHSLRQSPLEGAATKVSRKTQFISLIRHTLVPHSDKPGHVRTQLMLLKCLDLMYHTELVTHGFTLPTSASLSTDAQLLTKLPEGQPDLDFSAELVPILLEHIGHPDRDMATLPAALYPLLFLSEHDHGFIIVRNALESPSARIHGKHFFANMVQRVNDCFSAENPDCQITPAICLRLLQSLLVGRSSLPITFSTDDTTTDLRRLHISSTRVRDWIGWSGGEDEGKPVRDLHALLEMLTDDEPSLEYLRSGMKNLLSLLSEEFDIPECELMDDVVCALPKPHSLEDLFAARPQFISLSELKELNYRDLLVARRQLLQSNACRPELPELSDAVIFSSDLQPTLVVYNFSDLAINYCGITNIKEELTKCGRQRASGEAAIRHQKRRRGHSSIIETGRSSKKFVAPMRGRGFILRGAFGKSNSASTFTTGSLLGGPTSVGVRPDPFRSRPLNTSRPPSLHVDDFTKLVKDDAVAIEDVPRSRPYRDTRGFRGRIQRNSNNRGAPSGSSLAGSLVPNLAFGLPIVNPLGASLLPSWSAPRDLPFLFNLGPRMASARRDRTSR